MEKESLNRSATYLLPLAAQFINFDQEFNDSIVNFYIEDDFENKEKYIYVIYEFDFKNSKYTNFEHKLISNELIELYEDIDNMVLYKFKFPEEYHKEYELFTKSKFSKFGEDAKEIILTYWSEVYSGNKGAIPFLLKTKQILYRDLKLKKEIENKIGIKIEEGQELCEFVDIDKEGFKLSKWNKKLNLKKPIEFE